MITTEIPFPPAHPPMPGGRIEPPLVSVEARWEYKEVVRKPEPEGLLSEAELNALGEQHWELAGVVMADHLAHFYFKRARWGDHSQGMTAGGR